MAAIGGVAAILIPALQYGVPAAQALIALGEKWVSYWKSDAAKELSQEEFSAKWEEMQNERKTVVDAHLALRAQGR